MKNNAISWPDLVQREPRLAQLLEDVKNLKPALDGRFCNYRSRDYWAPRLARLCGYSANCKDPLLRTAEAFGVAASVLRWAALPCSGCEHDLAGDRERAE